MKISIDPLEFEELDELAEMEKICFAMPWSKESFERELLNQMAYYICARADGILVGYVGIWKICDEGHITNVAVLPNYRQIGIGKILIQNILKVCEHSEINSVTLEVRKSNTPALKLYEKFGFEVKGKRPNYYSKPTEDALIMWKTIQQSM